MRVDRRDVLGLGGLAALAAAAATRAGAEEGLPEAIARLGSMTEGLEPIAPSEHLARIERARALMAQEGFDAVVVGGGSTLLYFTGLQWGVSERLLALVLPRDGELVFVVPAFERGRAEERIRVGGEVRAWQEDESPFVVIAGALRDRRASSGRIGIEETMPFDFSDGIGAALPAARLASAAPVTAGCRMVKDAHEIALMRRAGQITLHAHRAVFASLRAGMTQGEVARLSAEAHRRLGVTGGSLVLFGPDAAFPHGTSKPKALQAGDVVLIDGGGKLHGYASDITRTAVFGAPATERQRRVFEIVRAAQQAAFRAARPGAECQAVDGAARRVVEDAGFGPGFRLFTHRLGHGVGLDGHERPYLVPGNALALKPGMCVSNEPGIYLPGELGIRHEDVMVVTEDGAESLTPTTGTPEDPAVV